MEHLLKPTARAEPPEDDGFGTGDLPLRPSAAVGHNTSLGVGRALRAANKAYNRRLQERLAEGDVGLAEFLHLRELWITDGLSQIELARRIGIEKASSTHVISGLEDKGIIRRVRNSKDRRVINVFVTEKGHAMRADVLGFARTVALDATTGFSRTELETLVDLLGRFSDGLADRD